MNEISEIFISPLPLPAAALLPHRPPMLFVETLVARHGNRSTARAVLPDSGICVSENRLLPEYFIELVAQATALANGYDGLCLGRPVHDGMLVGIDGFSFHGRATEGSIAGRVVRIETEKTFEFGAIKVIHGEVYNDRELLAAGDIKVWEDLSRDAMR
ncbi:MAG: acyl carrier protein dehydratase [uncultured bacterium]|nr:MAG: acyl carrier protein dehydratase [uncultured bacterium]